MVVGPEFESEQGRIMVFKIALYELNSSGAAFRANFAGLLNDIRYNTSKAYPEV